MCNYYQETVCWKSLLKRIVHTERIQNYLDYSHYKLYFTLIVTNMFSSLSYSCLQSTLESIKRKRRVNQGPNRVLIHGILNEAISMLQELLHFYIKVYIPLQAGQCL